MEERPLLVLGSDLTASPLIARLCSEGVKGIIAVDSHIEPGGYLGTHYGVGFRFEKLPLLVPESSLKPFEEAGFKLECRELRVGVAKQGNHALKASCWRAGAPKPWWYPELAGRLCYCKKGWGASIRPMVSGPCSEYTYYLPRKVDIARRVAILRNGRVIRYRLLVSTIPLPVLLDSLYQEGWRDRFRELAGSLDWVDMLTIALGVRGEPPGYDVVLHGTRASRVHTFYIWSNIDPTSSPPGFYLVEMLMSYCREHPPPPDQVSRGFAEARWARLVSDRGSVVSERVYTIPYIQPVSADRSLLRDVVDHLEEYGIFLAGVGGRWENIPPDRQVEEGLTLSDKILSSL